MSNQIQVNDLTIGYDKPIMSDLNFTFEDNMVYGILGESGRGKSTFLKTLAGLMYPLSGEILINDKLLQKAHKNNVYMMHQSYTSFDWKTCLDNVLIAKSIKEKLTLSDYDMASQMLKLVHLDGYEHKYPKQLSGGMRQRLALARTLFVKPEIILMDEPLSALDEITRKEMQDLILKIHHETGNIIIMVTHSSVEADYMCDKIIHF